MNEVLCKTLEPMECPSGCGEMTAGEVFTIDVADSDGTRIRCASCSPRLLEELG